MNNLKNRRLGFFASQCTNHVTNTLTDSIRDSIGRYPRHGFKAASALPTKKRTLVCFLTAFSLFSAYTSVSAVEECFKDSSGTVILGTNGVDKIPSKYPDNPGADVPERICGRLGNDELRGFGGNDYISGGPGNDFINGNMGYDYLTGGPENDRVRGGQQNDTLYGGPGDDFLGGDLHNDWLYGNDGNDTYVYRKGDGIDTIFDSSGNDRLWITGTTFDGIAKPADVKYKKINNALEIRYAGSRTILIEHYYSSGQIEHVYFGGPVIDGQPQHDVIGNPDDDHNSILRRRPDNNLPYGKFESITGNSISGWAFDANDTQIPVDVEIHIDGVWRFILTANNAREDVLSSGEVPSVRTGFQGTIPSDLSPGIHDVRAYAIDTDTREKKLLGSQSFNKPKPAVMTVMLDQSEHSSGKVTGSGIDCPSDCSHSYNAGDRVTLTAIPSKGSTFEGWNGTSCSNPSCVVTMNETKTITANFNNKPPIVELLSPADDAKSQERNLVLTWQGKDLEDKTLASHEVFFGEVGQQLGKLDCNVTGGNNGFTQFTCKPILPLLDYDKWYVWTVTGMDQGGASTTKKFRFKTKANQAPVAENPSPPNDTVIQKQQIDNLALDWDEFDPDGKELLPSEVFLWFFDDAAQRQLICDGETKANCNTLLSGGNFISPGSSYFWQVKVTEKEAPNLTNEPMPLWIVMAPKNRPPYQPRNPQPEDESQEVDDAIKELRWSWAGDGQPDPDEGDKVIYKVYLSDVKSKLNDLSSMNPICSRVSSAVASCPVALEPDKTYYWRVVATDEHGLSTKGLFWQFDTKALPEPAKATFEVNFSEGVAPFDIKFTDISSGEINSWLWDFGVKKANSTENETSTEQHPTFTYTEPGTYTATLTVKDKAEQESSKNMDITVNDLELVSLTLGPSDNSMNLDWSAESINTYIPKPTDTIVEFWRTPEPNEDTEENWQKIDTVTYMDSLISANQYFDKNTFEPQKMKKDKRYCYYFKVFEINGDDANLLTQSEVVCDTFGAVRIFINKVASAAPGDEVKIPVRISNAQDLKISAGKLKLVLDNDVIVVDKPNIDLTVTPSSLLWDTELEDFSYDIGPTSKIQEHPNGGRIVDFDITGNDQELPSEIYGGQELFFWIFGKVRNDVLNGTTAQFSWEPNGSSLNDVKDNGIILSFGNATFQVKKGSRLRDSKLSLIADGVFTVDTTGRLGDPNLNAWIDPDDGKLVLRHIADSSIYPFTEQQLAAADANGNGKIDANDAAMIFYYSYYGEWPSLSSDNSQSKQDDSPMIIKLDNISGESGTETETTLNVENLSDFTGGEFILSYDPSVVEGISSVKRTRFTKKFSVTFSDNNDKGLARIAMASREPINGSGDLVTVKLRLKSETTLRKRTRDGASIIGKRSANLVLAQTQLYDPYARNFVTSILQRTVKRQNAEVVRTDVIEEEEQVDDENIPDNPPDEDTPINKLPKIRGHLLDKIGNPIVGVTVQMGDQTTVTDETSYWEILDVAKGNYTVTAHKEGYRFVPQTVQVENDNVTINLEVKADPNTPEILLHNANGYIFDMNTKPIAGVTVQIDDKTALTDDAGYWRISGLTEGVYTVTAQKEDLQFVSQTATITNSDVVVQMSLAGPYSASGIIRDKSNQPLEGVLIQIGNRTAVTDANGSWQISGLWEGHYTINASKEGYFLISKKLEVGNEQDPIVNLILDSVLELKVIAEPQIATQGEDISYTITVTNKGDETATGIVLTDAMPAENTRLVSIEAMEGSNCDASAMTCSLPDLTPGASAAVKVVVNSTQAGKLQNTATVTTNEYPANVRVIQTTVIPYLSVSLDCTPNPVEIQGTLHCQAAVDLTANAPNAATGIVLAITLPSGVELQSLNSDVGACDISNLPTITCSMTDLNPIDINRATVDMDIALTDAGLLALTHQAKVSANEYPAHTSRERTNISLPQVEVDIAFVIDVTGSMQEEINGIIKALQDFIAEIDSSETPLIALVVFTDDVKVKAFTSDMNVLLGAVKKLKANGGGTCPEASAEALLIAIPHTKQGGYILFVTDASPYEDSDIERITELLRSKGIRFNTIISGDCTQAGSWNQLPNAE